MSEKRDLVEKVVTSAKLRLESKLGEIWWIVLSRGLLALVLSACAFVWPQQTLQILIKLLGATILIDGLVSAFVLFYMDDRMQQAIGVLVSFVIGSVLLLWTGVTAKLFLIVVGAWMVVQGFGLFQSSRRIGRADGVRNLMSWVGAIMALIGIVFILWTDTGIVAISWLIGLGALLIGSLLIYLATRIRRLRNLIANPGEPT